MCRFGLWQRLLADEAFERVTGIEPAFSAWEADVLPLNYTRGMITEYSLSLTMTEVTDFDVELKVRFRHNSYLSVALGFEPYDSVGPDNP